MDTNIINFKNVAKVIANGKTISKILIALRYRESRTLWEYQFDPSILTFTAEESNSKIKLDGYGYPAPHIVYSLNNEAWKDYDFGTELTLGKSGNHVMFKTVEDIGAFSSNNSRYNFSMTGQISASGNVMWLVDPTGKSKTIPCGNCFEYLFSYCSALTHAPELPATTIADNCYYNMFDNCSSLSTAPQLPATLLANNCYNNMFAGCTSLSAAPELPATTLANNCYTSMFYNCTSLSVAPLLPATLLADSCYHSMFQSCTSLTTAPELSATLLADYCYCYMFYSCSSLKISNTEKPDGTKILDIPIGIEYKDGWNGQMFSGYDELPGAECNFEGDPEIGKAYWSYWKRDKNDLLCFTAEEDNSKISLIGNSSYNVKLAYSLNDLPWKEYTIGTVLDLNKDEYVFFKALKDVGGFSSPTDYYMFLMEGKIAASGNIMWLVDPTGKSKTIPCGNCFVSLFSYCSALTHAPQLPATLLAIGCYSGMFYYCTSLSAAPLLPATLLAIGCYDNMFVGCTSLTAAPELPATLLADYCYYSMFSRCTSLTAAPLLPATLLADYCYSGMFVDCSSLTAAPELPATLLADYCYEHMFAGCSSLSAAPLLPATLLAEGCYYGMFYDCTSMTAAPLLPATLLAGSCYYGMFYGCQKLKISDTEVASGTKVLDIPVGTEAKANWNAGMFYATGGTFKGDPKIGKAYWLY